MRVKVLVLACVWVAYKLLIPGPQEALSQSAEDFLGDWGYVVLGKGGKGSWFGYKTEAGTITINEDGTLATSYKESADRCPGANFCLENAEDPLS